MMSKTLQSILDQISDQLNHGQDDLSVKAFGKTFEVIMLNGQAFCCVAGMNLSLRTLKSMVKINHQLTNYVF